jgi:hypothetical protein
MISGIGLLGTCNQRIYFENEFVNGLADTIPKFFDYDQVSALRNYLAWSGHQYDISTMLIQDLAACCKLEIVLFGIRSFGN